VAPEIEPALLFLMFTGVHPVFNFVSIKQKYHQMNKIGGRHVTVCNPDTMK
jgi:hypothetical protein